MIKSATWFFGIAAVTLFAALGWYLAPLKPNILALQFAFTPRSFGAVIHVWPPEHLARYRAHLPVDGLLLLAYGTWGYLFASGNGLMARLRGVARCVGMWALPAAAVFDAVEDGLHWWLTESPRFDLLLPYWLAAFSACLKWIMALAFLAAVLYAVSRAPED